MPTRKVSALLALSVLLAGVRSAAAREYHVSVRGSDKNDGSAARPLRTITAAARLAQPGDVIIVHEGTYRERIAPPRGGTSERNRIVYTAAPGEKVIIKGSEIIKGWRRVKGDTWKVTLPSSFFGDFNPYSDLIHGDWFNPRGRKHHTGAVYLNGHWLAEAPSLKEVLGPPGAIPLWFAEVNEKTTTIWAQFKGVDPNKELVEINVRRTIFYPERPGVNFITVRGFTMMHAATPWAPPTAEQVGLIGTHWSKGWIIENNDISYSICVGISLGKYGDKWDNTSQNTAQGYVKTIQRALAAGWSKADIGHHIVRNNRISHCEQAGIVGSLGAVFSRITGNVIHHIHVRRLFSGAEMAGIKIHAAIDTVISRNHIYRCCRGIWLDWMAQGTRVTGNLLHDNGPWEDLFVEVNHGPFLIDNNFFLSRRSLFDMSEGGAYAHNLFAGTLAHRPELRRRTPFHPPHSTKVAGLRKIVGGDDRFFNNIFIAPAGLTVYDNAAMPVFMEGNVFLKGAKPSKHEPNPLVLPRFDPKFALVEKNGALYVRIILPPEWRGIPRPRKLVTTELLGRAEIPKARWEKPDGSPYRLDRDYLGRMRDLENPYPGPLELPKKGPQFIKVWP